MPGPWKSIRPSRVTAERVRARRVLIVLAAAAAAGILYAHFLLPAQIENAQNINLPHEPYAISDEARSLHKTLFIADLHSDSLLWKRNLLERSSIGHMDLPRLREGNVALQVFSATTKSPVGQNYERNEAGSDNITRLAIASFWPPRTWTSLFERAAFQLRKLEALDRKSELRIVYTSSDLRELVAGRERGEPVIGALYLIEGAHPLEGDIENLDRLFEQGLRIVGLTHFFDNELGGSLHGMGGAGLSGFGAAVVDRAGQLGMTIDVAHASPAMVDDVLARSTRPVILSHGGLQGVCPGARNLGDPLMRRIADRGGLVGIGYWDAAVCDVSPAGVVASIRYAIDLLGVERVALGSDYDGATAVAFDTSELVVLTDAMLAAGFSEHEIRLVMGENVKRFLLEYLP
jgi:microsomal dipeptidase-like Zn-dependent dipeptidase